MNFTNSNTLPQQPMSQQQQSAKLQRLGLDFLSSVHWVAIVVVAVLFAGFVVVWRRHKASQQTAVLEENDAIIEEGRKALSEKYFEPDGRLAAQPFMVRKSRNVKKSDTDEEECGYAVDELNNKLNEKSSQKILPQLRQYVKTGKLFSFFNSMASANDKLSAKLRARGKVELSDDQKFEQQLRAQYGRNPLRNPLIDLQIRKEMQNRQERKESELLSGQQLEQLEDAFKQ